LELHVVTYSLKVGEMNDLAASLRSALRRIEAELRCLEAAAEQLRTDWNGDAAIAYDAARVRWRGSMERLNRTLGHAGGAAERAVELHLSARATVTNIWS
jgi:WXG100 family type VII secretion target